MISQRIIGVVLIYENICVQSIKFKKILPIGRPEISQNISTDSELMKL